jgi:hypothetical protein
VKDMVLKRGGQNAQDAPVGIVNGGGQKQ